MGSIVSSTSTCIIEEEDVRPFFTALVNFMQNDQLERAKYLIKKLSKKERAAVSRLRDDNDRMTLLFHAAYHGHTSFVNFLLEDCCAEIEKRCVYIQGSGEWMTPLCCAAVNGRYEVVKALVRHGADVNALSEFNPDDATLVPALPAEQLTIVQYVVCSASCSMDVVRFLIEKGADINQPSSRGTTCLMDSVTNVELCHFLIQQHASVNAVDRHGDSALHIAIYNDSFDCVKLLIEHGADTSICNNDGDDALQLAALCVVAQTLEYLIQEIKPTPQTCADVYSLLAATMTLDKHHTTDEALPYWIKSVNIRMEEECTTDSNETVHVVGPNAAFNFAVEAKDIDSLMNIAEDDDSMNMHALVVLDRIVGPNHWRTHWGLQYCAAQYAYLGAYQRCIDLLMYDLKQNFWHNITKPESYGKPIATLEQICWAFSKMSSQNPTSIHFVDVHDVLEMVVENIRGMMSYPSAASMTTEQLSNIVPPWLIIQFIDLLLCSASTENETSSCMQLVHTLLKARLRTPDGRTLLHTAILPANFCVWFGFGIHYEDQVEITMPTARSSAIAECLLTAGAAVNEVDSDGNTPLHLAVFNPPTGEEMKEDWEKMVDVLLNHGAHVDMANAKGEVVFDKLPANVDIFKHVSLKCLAARAVRAYQLQYRGIVPGTLADFVDTH